MASTAKPKLFLIIYAVENNYVEEYGTLICSFTSQEARKMVAGPTVSIKDVEWLGYARMGLKTGRVKTFQLTI